MPLTPVTVTTAPTIAIVPETSAPPAPGFERALAARLRDPRSLPSLSLGQMVDAFAGRPATPSVDATTADPWGAAALAPASVHGSGPGTAVLAAGERYLGIPYLWGGTTAAHGFDCSGLVQQVYADLGISLPRVSVDQARAGTAVSGGLENAQPGDLVFWRGDASRPNHIGIYAGEGRMLVAPRTGDVVKYQDITRPPDAIRRVLP